MHSTWSASGLFRLDWNEVPGADEFENVADDRATEFQLALERFFQGENGVFDWVDLDPTGWTPFSSRVYRHCRTIAPGTTVTYQALARLAGNAKASRAVGGAMARNRIVLVIPCHRVIASSGKLQGFSAPGGLETKQRLIDMERLRASSV